MKEEGRKNERKEGKMNEIKKKRKGKDNII
jgi:hypothetical protein